MNPLEEIVEELYSIIKEIDECPYFLDEATIPKNGIEANPSQVVANMSISLMKIQKVSHAVKKYRNIFL
jgi:hypothetical protein